MPSGYNPTPLFCRSTVFRRRIVCERKSRESPLRLATTFFTGRMKTARPFLVRLSAVCILGTLALDLQAAASKPVKPDAPETTQAERAEAAMAKSLEQQQASLDAFKDSFGPTAAPSSFQQQQASLQQQAAVLTGQDKGTVGSWSIAKIANKPAAAKASKQAGAAPKTDTAQTEVAQSEVPHDNFFAVPWPSSAPMVVPNVQMMDDSCQALPKNDVDQLVDQASKKHGVDVDLLRSVMRQESGFKPCAVSVAGAMGLMQIMPDTAEMLKLDDPFDPQKNVDAGASFLKMMLDRYQGNVTLALGAYNAGPGKVDKAGGVPPIAETMQYITSILGYLPLAY